MHLAFRENFVAVDPVILLIEFVLWKGTIFWIYNVIDNAHQTDL